MSRPTRRHLLLAAGSLAATAAARAQEPPQRPDPADFQAGDFLWPRRPDQWVPYHAGAVPDREADKQRWLAERNRFVARVRESAASTAEQRQLAADLEGMDYAEFHQLYVTDTPPSQVQPFGSGGGSFYVGHVAVVDFDGTTPVVVEALDGRNVVRSTYAQWLQGRPGAWVWHGRLAGRPAAERARIAQEAAGFLGTPYDFWNLDLSDPAGFYCSKLCWLATLRATGVALDGNPQPGRAFWFSPKQMLKSRFIDKRFNPGSYTF